MKRYITIDGGTTNTRVNLVEDKQIIATKKISRGAKAGIDDRDGLKSELKTVIASILYENNLTERDITKILASGMITSEFGLYELPHLISPVGIKELHDGMAEVAFPEISDIPFVFIRGVKMNSNELDKIDMMRGEETELVGLMALQGGMSEVEQVYILPGSHSKIISVDKDGRISDFVTMLTGEMIAALSQNTILKDAVDLSCAEYDDKYLTEGYRYAKSVGLNKALFKVRSLKNIFKRSAAEVYSFFIGAVLSDEIDYISALSAKNIVIGGRQQIKLAMEALLKATTDKNITVISEKDVNLATALGVIRIFEYKF